MVYRLYVEKKAAYAHEAHALLHELTDFLRIGSLESLRILNRYDVEGIDRALFDRCRTTVFSEPQVDDVYDGTLESIIRHEHTRICAVEPLPGQYDQRSDSAAQCVQMVSQGERPLVASARVYILSGSISDDEFEAIKKHLINPVENREASLETPATLTTVYEAPASAAVLNGFRGMSDAGMGAWVKHYGLAMDEADLRCCRDYFIGEGRDPSVTELRVLDTYWSDHCRHTTFSTVIDDATFADDAVHAAYRRYLDLRKALGREDKPVTLMDIATIGAKYLKHTGVLTAQDESEEINACSVKVDVTVDDKSEPWLLMFKNETHNHPTEIEPFGGAATCIGGAIRDPLSGRAYVYQAMRISGASNPLTGTNETLAGKLPQRTLVTTAAAGNSSYGNQIGLATGLVHEIYHPGYVAKHLELGAVVGAAPASHVVRQTPVAGDVVILLGGRTGRDGCGGATGSSKAHTASSLARCGSEVQKGNAPEERKLQRLFRNADVTRLIKRCNDFGAGGVSVAIGELARGLEIDLDRVPKKYEGLDGTELAISESQERMAVVVATDDAASLLNAADAENLEATVVAIVTDDERLRMKLNGAVIVDIAREFLDTNGAAKHTTAVVIAAHKTTDTRKSTDTVTDAMRALVTDLNVCSQQGLAERFDSTIGASTVLMPFGGTYQATPTQVTAMLLPVQDGVTTTTSLMAYGYDPFLTERDPYAGAYLAVVESVAKVLAAGGTRRECYLSLQEYFEKLEAAPEKWGKPLAALLGALDAQLDLQVAAIGGKDSMSGSFEALHVPPTLVSFAVSVADAADVVSPEFKLPESRVVVLTPARTAPHGIPDAGSLTAVFDTVERLIRTHQVLSAYAVGVGGIAEALFKMCLGNRLGFRLTAELPADTLFASERAAGYGAIVLELASGAEVPAEAMLLGETTADYCLQAADETIDLADLQCRYESVLQPVYPFAGSVVVPSNAIISKDCTRAVFSIGRGLKPKAFVPVFPGTNCEYDTARAITRAGAEAVPLVIRNLSKEAVTESITRAEAVLQQTQFMVIPGGFSGGDEPDGSGKFITAFFRNPRLADAVTALLDTRDGLILGICNGFQALIKLGLVPFGKIIDTDADCPTLTFNTIGRHQSMLVHTRIASANSPWLAGCAVGDIHTIPVSHGEGRFIAGDAVLQQLAARGQIAAQYARIDGTLALDDARSNPNGSVGAVEAITSPDGRVLGKMGHSERWQRYTYRNVPGNYDQRLFESATAYFSS